MRKSDRILKWVYLGLCAVCLGVATYFREPLLFTVASICGVVVAAS